MDPLDDPDELDPLAGFDELLSSFDVLWLELLPLDVPELLLEVPGVDVFGAVVPGLLPAPVLGAVCAHVSELSPIPSAGTRKNISFFFKFLTPSEVSSIFCNGESKGRS